MEPQYLRMKTSAGTKRDIMVAPDIYSEDAQTQTRFESKQEEH